MKYVLNYSKALLVIYYKPCQILVTAWIGNIYHK